MLDSVGHYASGAFLLYHKPRSKPKRDLYYPIILSRKLSNPNLPLMQAAEIITDLQTRGVDYGPQSEAKSRRGVAGPTDHKALTIDGLTVMVPVIPQVPDLLI